MIQLLIPALVFAGLVAGCSKKPKTENEGEGLDYTGRRYFLDDLVSQPDGSEFGGYLVVDQDEDGYLGPNDLVARQTPRGVTESPNWSVFSDFVSTLGHRQDQPLHLDTAEAYLRYNKWKSAPDLRTRFRLYDSVDENIMMFYDVEDFATENSLEFSAELYLSKLQGELSEYYSEGCGELLDKKMRRSLSPEVDRELKEHYMNSYRGCKIFADGLDHYFGFNESADLVARRQRILGSAENPSPSK
ncbi:MAG TPA: hypothetical protein VJR29_01435 [bacterium]|nr:hypothetical protein [bacterium]